MTEIKATIQNLSFDLNGGAILSFKLQGSDGRAVYDEYNGKDLTLKISKFSPKRSKNANAYFWELCGRLSEKLNIPKDEVYREQIRHVGVYKDFQGISVPDAKTLRTAWEMLGTGWITEQVDYDTSETVTVRCYYGSSQYNTRQMSRLIDNIVQDCEAVGINTMTPQELSLLKSEWEAVK